MQICPQVKDEKVYSLNEYFSKRLNENKILVTTRHGCWLMLDDDEYGQLIHNTFSENKTLFDTLENTGIIITKQNVKQIVNRYSANYLFLKTKNILCTINITNRCPLRCTYCLASANPPDFTGSDMDEDILKSTSEFISELPFEKISIEFQGGEPLVRFDQIQQFLTNIDTRMANFKNKRIISRRIVTNLVLMDEDIAKYIMQEKIGICSSFDGPKELHDQQRKYLDGTGSYDIVVKWVDYFKERRKRVNLLPTITRLSLQYGAKSIIDEYIKMGCDVFLSRPVNPIGRANNKKDIIKAEDFFEFWKDAIEYLITLSEKGSEVYDAMAQRMLRNMLTPYRPYMCMRRPCGAGISQLSFTCDGSIHACDLSKSIPEFKIGTVNNSCQEVLLNTLELRTRSTEFYPLCDTCVFSPYCHSCACRTFSDFKSIVGQTPKSFDCKLNKMMFTYLFEKMNDAKYRKVFENWVYMKR